MSNDKEQTQIIAGSGGGCFRAGTQVQLENGKSIAIELLSEGDEVLAFDEHGKLHVAKVIKLHIHEDPQPLLRVKFWRGETHITPNHWVLNQYGNFAEMGSLTEHDALVDGMGHLRPIISAEYIGHEPVYNLTVEPHHTFIADGVRVHNGGHRERFPVVAGAGGGGGKGGGGGRAAVEDADTLQSRAMIGIIDLLGEGQIGGLVDGAKSIFFNNTPLQNSDGSMNFNGVTWEFRDGQQDQSVINGFSDVETPNVVNVRVKKSQPSVVTVTNPNADAVRMIMVIPALYSQDMSTGDVHGTTLNYKFQVQTNNSGPYVDVASGRQTVNLSGTSTEISSGSYIYDASIKVSWTGDLNTSTTPDYQTFAYEVQGSRDGGNWTTFTSGVINGTRSQYDDPESGASYIAPTGSKTHNITTPDGIAGPWAFKVVKKSGYGSAVITGTGSAGTAEVRISGKTRSKYQRAHEITLPKPATTWNIKTVRITDDSTSMALVNELWVDSVVEIVNSKLTYPNSAIVGVQIDSSQFSSIPARSYLVDGLHIRVPSNYDPVARTYSGIWDGTFKIAISNNPAWVLYDILTSERYGLGNYLNADLVDRAKLYSIGRYCDGLVPDGFGGTEPRFVLNTAIQNQSEAFRLINDLCSVFNGMSYWNGGMLGFTQDSPTDASMIYNQANVIDGVFTYQGTARKDRHSVVLVRWNDPTQNYKQVVEYVEDADLIAKFGVRKFETVAFGCTSRGQANRVGRWILYTEHYQSEMIQFKVGIDSAFLLPGEVIKIHDSTRAGKRMSGRLKSCTTASIELDTSVTLSGPATISIRMPDGSFVDRELHETNGTFNTLTWSWLLPEVPEPNAVWIVADGTVEPIYARVISIAQGDNAGEFVISALNHDRTKYGVIEQNLNIQPPQTSILSSESIPAQPENPKTLEIITTAANGVKSIRLDVSWTTTAPTSQIAYRHIGGVPENWVRQTLTTSSLSIPNVESGIYEIEIVSVNWLGRKSTPLSFSHEVLETTYAPPMPEATLAHSWTGTTCDITWQEISIADSYDVEVWHDGTMLRSTNITQTSYSYTLDMNRADGGPYRSLTFKVRSVSAVNGLKSVYSIVSESNPQMAALSTLKLIPGAASISISYDRPADSDWAGVMIFASLIHDFVPSAENMIYDGAQTVVQLSSTPLLPTDTWYVKIAAYDVFDKLNLSVSAPVSAMALPLTAGLIPGEIIGTNIAAGALTAEKLKTKRHQIL